MTYFKHRHNEWNAVHATEVVFLRGNHTPGVYSKPCSIHSNIDLFMELSHAVIPHNQDYISLSVNSSKSIILA